MKYEIELIERIVAELLPKKTHDILLEIDSSKLQSIVMQLIRYETIKSLETTIGIQGYQLKKLIPFKFFIITVYSNKYIVKRLNDYSITVRIDF